MNNVPKFEPVPVPEPEPIYTIPEIAVDIKLKPSGVYQLVRRGTIKAIKIGGSLRVTAAERRRLLSVGAE